MPEDHAPSRSGPRPRVQPLTDAGRPEMAAGIHASGLFAYIRAMSSRQQIVICGLACLVAALETVPLDLQRRMVNEAIGRQNLRLLIVLGGGFLVAILVQGGLKYALRVYGGAVSEDVIRNARRRLFEVATAAAGDAGDRPGSGLPTAGRAVSVIGPEIDGVGSFVGEGLAEPLVQGGTFIGLLGYMLIVDPLLAAVSLALFAPQAALLPWVQQRVNRLTHKRVRLMRAMGDAVAEATTIAGAADGRQSPRFGEVAAAFQDRLTGIRDNRVRIFRWQYFGKVLVNVFSHLGPLTVLLFGGYLVIIGQTNLGVIVAFVSGFERLAEPARELSGFYQVMAMTRVQFHTIGEWVDTYSNGSR
jgi:ABC-type multidrug transport system fused ATPase/permease subunit